MSTCLPPLSRSSTKCFHLQKLQIWSCIVDRWPKRYLNYLFSIILTFYPRIQVVHGNCETKSVGNSAFNLEIINGKGLSSGICSFGWSKHTVKMNRSQVVRITLEGGGISRNPTFEKISKYGNCPHKISCNLIPTSSSYFSLIFSICLRNELF